MAKLVLAERAFARSILRIGAREQGIFRNHMITVSGRIRHAVYFSTIDSEWPAVKARLEAKLNSRKHYSRAGRRDALPFAQQMAGQPAPQGLQLR